MNYSQILKPVKLNLDKSPKHLTNGESFFLLNHEVNNPAAVGKATPMAANYLACDMELPAGENFSIGRFYSELTNETYSWHYNSHGVNHIQRINGEGICEIVYDRDCLILNADPKHSIEQWRVILDVDYLCNKVPGGKLKRLIWVDGTDTPMGCLDVEASIATDSFTTPFFDICPSECSYIQMCVPEPQGCLHGEFVPLTNEDKFLPNRILDKAFKFAYRDIYYDGRASELGAISSLYYLDAKGCFDSSDGASRCIKFRIPLGNPLVEKKEFYFTEDGGVTWFLYDTIEKYKKYNSSQQYWYQRELTEEVSSTYSDSDCAFDYLFCNDKQKITADPKLITRVTNPIPRETQGIVRIGEAMAAYNYVVGTCPIDKSELDKITLDINCEDTTSCNSEWAEVVARAIIYNPFPIDTTARTGFIYRSGGAVGVEDDVTDIAHFGMGVKAYEQSFKGKVRNFIAYIEATNYTGEMVQWKSAPGFAVGNRVKIGHPLSGVLSDDEIDRVKEDIENGNFYYQEYKFKVPKGMKGVIRLVSHSQENALGANQNTSTQVVGVLPTGGLSTHRGNSTLTYNENIKELYFDTCSGNVDNLDAFIVSDLIYETDQYAYSGYITDKNAQPVAGAIIYANGSYKSTTDYNGFYFFASGDATEDIAIHVEQDCASSFLNIENFGASSLQKQMAHVNHEISQEHYKDNFLANVNVVVKDCNELPIAGVRVAMSGAKYKITDSDGIAHFKLRNYSTRNRSARAIVMDKNNCFTLDCFDGCNPCMPSGNATLSSCFQANPTYTITTTPKINSLNLIANKKSLKKGGIYDFGIVIEGDCGKISAVYEIKKFNIPKIQETNGFSVCSFTYNTNGAVFPLWANKVKFVRSVNLNPFTLQWVVDSIDRTIDNNIILTIQSLNDRNKQYNFKTNTVYQYAIGDRVEFIRNGDGTIFDTTTNGILNYQILSPFNDETISGVTNDTNYFNQIKIIDNGKLDALKEGAIIEIQPLSIPTTQVTYYDFCANFEIADGVPVNPVGTFTTFDTYLVNRQIGTFPPQYFEHKSPSDFWGETTIDGLANFISDIGRAYFVNQYENEKRYERNFSLNAANQINYFGDLVKTLEAKEQGYITAVAIKDNKIGLALCQNDNTLFQISDDLLRVGSDNVIHAAPADSIISSPYVKVRGEYGVSYEDIGSIFFGDGFAFFCDEKNNSAIIHNYQLAQKAGVIASRDGETESSCSSFFMNRMRFKNLVNSGSENVLDHLRYSVGQNKTNGIVYLTLKSLRHAGVNNTRAVYEQPNDTIIYNPSNDTFLGFVSFTPEGYSQLNLKNSSGCAFMTFQNSMPFIHPVVPDKWNSFFGIPCDWVIGVTLNQYLEKNKVALAFELQSDKMFFASKVTTDKPTFISEIPPSRWKQSNGKWNAALLNDVNSIGGLYNGQKSRGYFVSAVLVRDNTNNLEYNSINNAKREEYSEVDNIFVKFMLSESSGQTENL